MKKKTHCRKHPKKETTPAEVPVAPPPPEESKTNPVALAAIPLLLIVAYFIGRKGKGKGVKRQ
jgi:hypothetical protein